MVDTALGRAISDYAARVAASPSLREVVTVAVVRDSGFCNRATAGSGHVICHDEPVTFGGSGEAPDPAEALLAAIGSSLSVTITAHAALRGLAIHAVTSGISAWMSARSFFETDSEAPAGIQDAEIRVMVRSDEDPAALRTLVDDAVVASPVVASLRTPPRITLTVERGR